MYEFDGGVEGAYPEAGLHEGLDVASRAAAGIEDQPTCGDVREKTVVQLGHVHAQRVLGKSGGLDVVIADGAGH